MILIVKISANIYQYIKSKCKIITTFTKDYKDPIGSIVRETSSNNYDGAIALETAKQLGEIYNLDLNTSILLYTKYQVAKILRTRFTPYKEEFEGSIDYH